jgi:4-azaleucine resistance transporter AzlC
MTSAWREFAGGVRGELPILLGTVPFGLIYGASAINEGITHGVAQAMSAIVFAGSAQFIVAQFLGASVPGLVIVITAFVINLRHALYSASVAPYVRHLPRRWKWPLAYLMTDEAYAVAIVHYQQPTDLAKKHWYFLGAGLTLWLSWQVATAVGVFVGAQIPASWSLDFALPLTFIALVVPTIRDRAGAAAAIVAGIAAVAFAALPFKSGLLVATFAGILVGLTLERGKPAAEAKAPAAQESIL